MKKGFKTKVVGISLGLAAVLALVACGGGSSSQSPTPSSITPSSSAEPSKPSSSVAPSSSVEPSKSVEPSSSKPVEYGIAISNKTALEAAQWYVGATRKVELAVTPAGDVEALIAAGEIVVESDDEEVISVGEDGLTLTAVAAGEAEITVTYKGKEDSVEVEAEVNYEEIVITNKEALQAEWYVGDVGRTLDLATTPEGNIVELIMAKKISFVSSNPEVIAIANTALTAMGKGEATITVTLNGHSDSVDLEVKDVEYTSIQTVVEALKTKDTYESCHIRGVVTQVIDSQSCFIQEGDYGMYIYKKNYANIAVGDYVHCAASFKMYAGLPETDSCSLFSKFDKQAPEVIEPRDFNKDSEALEFEDINTLFNVEDLKIIEITSAGVAQSAYLFGTAKVGANDAGVYASKYTTEENMNAIMEKVNAAVQNGDFIKLTNVGLYWSSKPYFAISSPDQITLVPVPAVYPTGIKEIVAPNDEYVDGAVFKLSVVFDNDEECTKRAVTWESLNTDVATVAEDGTVTVLAPGKCSIKVTSAYEGYESITLTEEAEFGDHTTLDYGTLEDPLTCAEAIKLIDKFGVKVTLPNKIYVGGEVVKQSAYNSKYSNYDYIWLDNVKCEDGGFEVYQFTFDSSVPGYETDYLEADATKGFTCVAYGWAINFTGTYELTNKNPSGTTDKAKVVYLETEPTGVELDLESVKVSKGSTQPLVATWAPKCAVGSFSWGSEDVLVASVDNNGVITGVGDGTTNVYVYFDANENDQWDEGEIKASCAVEVSTAPVKLEEVEISGDEVNYFGEEDVLTATPTAGALGVTYEWSLAEGDEGKGTLTPDGATCKFVALGDNAAKTVTVKVVAKQSGADDVSDEFEITVNKWTSHAGTLDDPFDIEDAFLACDRWPSGSGKELYFKGVVSNVTTKTADIAKYGNLNFAISADGKTSGKQFTCYKTLNMDGAKILTPYDIEVGDEVLVKGDTKIYKKEGSADVYETQDNPVLISIVKKDASIRFSGVNDSYKLNAGENVTLKPVLGPTTGTDLGYTFAYVSDSAAATVDESGKVVAVSAGTAKITITASKAGCENLVKEITFTIEDAFNGAKFNMNGSITPNPKSDNEVKFTVGDTSVSVTKGTSKTPAGGDKQGYIGSESAQELRLYKGQVITISSTKTIKKITIIVTNNSGGNCEGSTFDNCSKTYTGSGTISSSNPGKLELIPTDGTAAVVITISQGAWRFSQILVEYAE